MTLPFPLVNFNFKNKIPGVALEHLTLLTEAVYTFHYCVFCIMHCFSTGKILSALFSFIRRGKIITRTKSSIPPLKSQIDLPQGTQSTFLYLALTCLSGKQNFPFCLYVLNRQSDRMYVQRGVCFGGSTCSAARSSDCRVHINR